MDKKKRIPVTPALRVLRASGVEFEEHLYSYDERGDAQNAAQCLGIDLYSAIKTLVFEDENKRPLLVLMHGDHDVAVGLLARAIGTKRVGPCAPEKANKHTGYLVGGTSPFGTRSAMPIYAEESIRTLSRIYVNGGKRGFLVGLTPDALDEVLHPQYVTVRASTQPPIR